MLFIRQQKPELNVQSDSITAKVFIANEPGERRLEPGEAAAS